jgi:hypothetical protein
MLLVVLVIACRDCQDSIRQFRVGTNQDLSLIVENATRNLHNVLCHDEILKTDLRPRSIHLSISIAEPLVIDLSPAKLSMPTLVPQGSSIPISEWVSPYRIVRLPSDIFKDRKAVRASSKVLNGDRPRFGPVHEVTVTRDSSRFVGKYFHYFDDSERRLSQYRDLMKRFCSFNHPCLSRIVY